MNRATKQRENAPGRRSLRQFILAGLGIVLLLMAAVLVWRSWQRQGSSAAAGVPGIQLSDVAGTQPGQLAPDFTVPTFDGSTYTLTDQRGRPVIILFIAYWCGSCIPEARALARPQREYGSDVSIVAVDVDPSSTPQLLQPFKEAADNGAFTWAFDTNQQVTLAYEVQALDTTLVLDSEGHVVYRDAFPTTYEQLKEILRQLGV